MQTMSAEFSPPNLPVRDQLLDLAAIICSREVLDLQFLGNDNVYRWTPADQNIFFEPIALDKIEITHELKVKPNYTVVKAIFHILGKNEMMMELGRDSETLNDDPLASLVLDHFETAYLQHPHYKCIRNMRLKKQEELRRAKIRAKRQFVLREV